MSNMVSEWRRVNFTHTYNSEWNDGHNSIKTIDIHKSILIDLRKKCEENRKTYIHLKIFLPSHHILEYERNKYLDDLKNIYYDDILCSPYKLDHLYMDDTELTIILKNESFYMDATVLYPMMSIFIDTDSNVPVLSSFQNENSDVPELEDYSDEEVYVEEEEGYVGPNRTYASDSEDN